MSGSNTGMNYSAHVVDTIPDILKNFRRSGMNEDAESLRAWRGMIQRSRKFLLPPSGHFFSQGKGLKEGIFPQRMPFPLVSLEVPHEKLPGGDNRGASSSRRHILCQEANMTKSGDGFIIDNNPKEAEGFFVFIFCYLDKAKQWMPQSCAGYIRYDVPTGSPDTSTFPGEAWAHNDHATFFFRRVPILHQLWDINVMQNGIQEAERSFVQDTAEEIRIAFEFLQVLACRNVTQVESSPSAILNAKRIRNGKEPIDKFYTLKIGDVAIGRTHSAYSQDSGFKVREHYRSGHIRRLGDRSVWVSDTIVALGSKEGRVFKRYAIRDGGQPND